MSPYWLLLIVPVVFIAGAAWIVREILKVLFGNR